MDNVLQDLLEFIDEEEIKELEITEDNKAISSADQANYYIKLVKELDEELDDIEKTAKEQLGRYKNKVDVWKNSQIAKIGYQKEYYEEMLKSYAIKQLEGSNKRSLKLIEGTLGFRKVSPKYNYDDEETIKDLELRNLPYINNDATVRFTNTDSKYKIVNDKLIVDGVEIGEVKVKKSIDKAALKKDTEINGSSLEINGTPILGVNIDHIEDNFSVK